MRFYMMTDLEGVAGVTQWENRADTGPYNTARRQRLSRLLTGEVNAAVDGLIGAGFDDVIVNDGHGGGNTIDYDLADSRAVYYHGLERPFWLPFLDETCDATGAVGAHSKASTPSGTLSHTMSEAVRRWSFNGIEVGETGLQALIAGYYGVPFVFAAGDIHLCREIEELCPGCVTVAVKQGTSMHSALTSAPARARELIREGAMRAIEAVDRVEPLRLESPVVFRDERRDPTWDEEDPGEATRVINAHVREIEGEDLMDVLMKVYTHYDRNYRPEQWRPGVRE
ncbi:MAG: M55 family metallopeptidase [candidate division WS1 bacterium]|jgi:D-amino peptidase|nr:M55 family metallopeptidase [candidate division WS1 bacterium]